MFQNGGLTYGLHIGAQASVRGHRAQLGLGIAIADVFQKTRVQHGRRVVDKALAVRIYTAVDTRISYWAEDVVSVHVHVSVCRVASKGWAWRRRCMYPRCGAGTTATGSNIQQVHADAQTDMYVRTYILRLGFSSAQGS